MAFVYFVTSHCVSNNNSYSASYACLLAKAEMYADGKLWCSSDNLNLKNAFCCEYI